MADENKDSLLFMADISGFTSFVNETEIEHSSHIIQELLETVASKNELGLEIAEIEGDAIFFYKKNELVGAEKLLLQAKEMFISFHEHLKIYERDRLCQCGACVSTSNLSLKFVAHSGEVRYQNIAGLLQLMGKEVTLLHKLMKNSIDNHEYLLLTDRFNLDEIKQDEFALSKNSDDYDGIGKIEYQYFSLRPLRDVIITPPHNRPRKLRTEKPILKYILINASVKKTHSVLIDLKKRSLWSAKTGFNEKQIERIGTVHQCILPQGTVPGYVIDQKVVGEEIIYEEMTDRLNALFPAVTSVYHLKPVTENSCEMRVEIHVHAKGLVRRFINLFLDKGVNSTLKKFKQLCERDEVV